MAVADRKPLIVQSDRTLFLEVDHPLHEEARDRLLPFAELVKSPEHVHTYRITPISLWNAAAAGLDASPGRPVLLYVGAKDHQALKELGYGLQRSAGSALPRSYLEVWIERWFPWDDLLAWLYVAFGLLSSPWFFSCKFSLPLSNHEWCSYASPGEGPSQMSCRISGT